MTEHGGIGVALQVLRIQRMPSEPDTEFGNPANYPYMCVASPSCHDTSTTRAWYEEDPDRRQRFYNNVGPSCPAMCYLEQERRSSLRIVKIDGQSGEFLWRAVSR